jgi:NAD(P)-dependent dehydrogenase (short-subunit alcohol dehydrogenase family)
MRKATGGSGPGEPPARLRDAGDVDRRWVFPSSRSDDVRVLRPRFRPGASVVLFGGLAKERPYPGSTMVTTFNGGVSSLVKTLAVELAPHRVNALHPGVVGDSPKWRSVPDHPHIARTPIGRLVTMAEVTDATEFLLHNTGINAQDLFVDGGVQVT